MAIPLIPPGRVPKVIEKRSREERIRRGSLPQPPSRGSQTHTSANQQSRGNAESQDKGKGKGAVENSEEESPEDDQGEGSSKHPNLGPSGGHAGKGGVGSSGGQGSSDSPDDPRRGRSISPSPPTNRIKQTAQNNQGKKQMQKEVDRDDGNEGTDDEGNDDGDEQRQDGEQENEPTSERETGSDTYDENRDGIERTNDTRPQQRIHYSNSGHFTAYGNGSTVRIDNATINLYGVADPTATAGNIVRTTRTADGGSVTIISPVAANRGGNGCQVGIHTTAKGPGSKGPATGTETSGKDKGKNKRKRGERDEPEEGLRRSDRTKNAPQKYGA